MFRSHSTAASSRFEMMPQNLLGMIGHRFTLLVKGNLILFNSIFLYEHKKCLFYFKPFQCQILMYITCIFSTERYVQPTYCSLIKDMFIFRSEFSLSYIFLN